MDNLGGPLVSIIVPTKDSSRYLERCLESIRAQSYRNIELIVVDNHSIDATKEIAGRYTENIHDMGPERSAQVNYGASIAKGDFIYKVDSDFILEEDVVSSCVDKAMEGYDAVVVHNTPDSGVSWIAKIRKFEVDMYKYDLDHSSARFVSKDAFDRIGGFNETITAGEDVDFQNRLSKGGFKTGFVDPEAIHLGEPESIRKHLKAYFQYGIDFVNLEKENEEVFKEQRRFLRAVYIRNWHEFIRHPLMASNFVAYDVMKYASGAAGYAVGLLQDHLRGSRMETDEFGESVDRYKELMLDLSSAEKWGSMDWSSRIFLDGWRQCMGVIDEYASRGSRVLDFGCGMGMMSVLLHDMGYDVSGIDIDIGGQPETVADTFTVTWGSFDVEKENPKLMTGTWGKISDRYGISFGKFDGKHIPFKDGVFDSVVAHAVFEHINPAIMHEVLEDVSRVLKPGGAFFVLRTPRKLSYMEAISRLLGIEAHDILYTEREIEDLVSEHGFQIVYGEIMDMLPAFMPVGMSVYNALFPLLIKLDRILLRTPLKKYAHHMALVFVKE